MMRPAIYVLLLGCLLPVSCGTVRKTASGPTPSQRYEYRTGPYNVAEAPEQVQEQSQGRQHRKEKTPPREEKPEVTSLKGHELILYARKFIGTPYRYGANGPDRFDCSGFTTYVYNHFGIRLPRSSRDQFSVGKPVRNPSQLQPGDLVFFARKGKIFHVGMAVESMGDHFTFIHASTSAGVIISRSDEKYWEPVYYGAKRIFE